MAASRKKLGAIGLLVVGLATILCATCLPVTAVTGTATPSIENINKHLSLSLDGSFMLPVATQAAAAIAAPTDSLQATTGIVTNAVKTVLPAPISYANSAVTLPGCGFIGLGCVVSLAKHVILTVANCSAPGLIINVVFSTHGCVNALKGVLGDLARIAVWIVSGTIAHMARTITKGMQVMAVKWANWVLGYQLSGKNTSTTPVVSCKFVENPDAAGCAHKDDWFLGQFNMMRQVALFMLVPLFMLVVIQSVIKGSMYLLIRSALVMLPVAIVGTVVAVFLVQLMLNLSDDFVSLISSYTSDSTNYATTFTNSVGGMNTDKVNWYALLWFIILALATFIIYIELLLRQLGVYMVGLFLPLAFAALVWPATAGFAKKMIELILGLIFSKVFIAAAVALGIAAFADSSSTGVATIPDNNIDSATQAGFTSLISGTLIMCMAAFAGTKVLAMTPAAMTAAEGRVMRTNMLWEKLQMSNAAWTQGHQFITMRNNNRNSRKRKERKGPAFSSQDPGLAPGATLPNQPRTAPRASTDHGIPNRTAAGGGGRTAPPPPPASRKWLRGSIRRHVDNRWRR